MNQNGHPDEDEWESVGSYSVSYINGKEVSYEECAACDMGDYEAIRGSMDWETLKTKL